MSGRPYNDYQDRDATLKIWLPKSLETQLDEVCTCLDTTKSDFIRQILFVHLYGRADFLALVKMGHPSLFHKPVDCSIKFSLQPGTVVNEPTIKNEVGIKLWLPERMKNDFDQLAIRQRMSMSSYARDIITTHLIGNIPYDASSYKEQPPYDFTED